MRLYWAVNYLYILIMKTLALFVTLLLTCPLSLWAQSAEILLQKVSDALSVDKSDYAVSLFRQAVNINVDLVEMYY